jgi:hypothetical protein
MSLPSPSSAVRDLLVERLDALLDDCDNVMDRSALGQTVHDLDDFLLIEGRAFIQKVYQEKLQERIERTEDASEAKQSPL